MKQAIELAREINRKKQAISHTKSKTLYHDCSVSVRRDEKQLNTYCRLKNIDISEVWKKAGQAPEGE